MRFTKFKFVDFIQEIYTLVLLCAPKPGRYTSTKPCNNILGINVEKTTKT